MFLSEFAFAFVATVLLIFILPNLSGSLRKQRSVRGAAVVLTGASSGIGKALAEEYARRGARLLLAARSEQQLKEVAQACQAAGSPEVDIVVTDVSKEDQCRNLVEKAVQRFGRIDVLLLNAGVAMQFFLEAATTTQGFTNYMDVNYYGCLWPAYYAIPHLRKSRGQIVVVSSAGGLLPFPRQTLYNASKHALMGLFNSLRMELNGEVGVTIACPGFVDTGMVTGKAIGRDGKPLSETLTTTNKKKTSHFVPLMTSSKCAQVIADAAGRGDRQVVTPWFYNIFVTLYFLYPGLLDHGVSALFMPKRKSTSKASTATS
eukprot:jgi/Chlat1/4658/Chrsp3S05607